MYVAQTVWELASQQRGFLKIFNFLESGTHSTAVVAGLDRTLYVHKVGLRLAEIWVQGLKVSATIPDFLFKSGVFLCCWALHWERQGLSLLGSGTSLLAVWAGQSPRDPPFSTFAELGLQMCTQHSQPCFMWVMGIPTQTLVFVRWVLYPLHHLSIPNFIDKYIGPRSHLVPRLALNFGLLPLPPQ